MNSTGPTATDIQSHLYNSFIQGNTHDVAIRVLGTWRAIYKLHRVVLIQSGFFRALFTAGFLESKSPKLRNGPDEITVVFDDLNITRPAFEICLSRLYGGGPPLHVSPNIIPTTDYPLTPPFAGVVETEEVPTGHQPASHRLLLSLLATSIYLSIPSVASQILSLILKTVGPTTVINYLNFACGKSLVDSDPRPADSKPAVGLENIANLLEDELANDLYIQSTKSVEGLKSLPQSSDRQGASESPEPQDSEPSDSTHKDASYHYGAVSDKIGEACACWIARWAVDVLQLETEDSRAYDSRAHPFTPSNRDKETPTDQRLVTWKKFLKVPVIFGREGLNAKWVAAFVSADTLFVKNERDRYDFARTIVELRRKHGVVDEEEDIWSHMFEYGIHYSNMTFEDLHFISQDISPITNIPYVSLRVLQMAHWQQSTLRHQIIGRGTVGASSPLLNKELGITLGIAEILTKLTGAKGNNSQMEERYYPVFVDQSLRIGDGGSNTSTTSMEDLFRSVQNLSLKHSRANTSQDEFPMGNIVTSEEKFFGISTPYLTGRDCADADGGKVRWSPYPPYRFSVEFWDVDILKEKNRLHSQTVWYAGSLFNVYVQVVRKKGQPQLGIYLHRQSHVDAIPASSIPAPVQDNSSNRHHHHQSLPNSLSLSQTSISTRHPPATPSETPANQESGSPPSPPSPSMSPTSNTANFIHHQPYRDPRATISAYFSINCASATGSSQTRFSSSPDTFSVSQSWGWKSSSLRTEEFLEIKSSPLARDVARGREVSLRATVVLGLV